MRLTNVDQAVRFVDERGFVYFWPIKGTELPSLWVAVAGDRPVADAHDDPGHVTWGWKDQLLGARRWYYGKILRGRATMISLKTLPYFYALSENYGDYRHDYQLEYDAGTLTQAAKDVFEALIENGPLDSLALRRAARMAGRDSTSRFERALVDLQGGFKILPVGVAEAGAWRYAFIYDIVDRFYPDLPAEARPIERGQARAHLARLHLRSVGAVTVSQVAQLFRWKAEAARPALDHLVRRRFARRSEAVAGQAGEWYVARELLK